MKDRDIVDNIRKFWLLQLIVDAGSFREAASRAKVTQSALSQTVTQLEVLTGRVLLMRDKGRVAPTEHCADLLGRVRPVLEAIAEITREEEDAPPISWMSIGAYESFASDFVPGLLTRLQLKCPGIKLTLRVGRSSSLMTLIRKGELCMAVVREGDDMGRLDVTPITTDRLAFWASPAHPAVEQGWAGLPEHEIGALAAESDGHPRYLKRLMDAAALKRHPMFVSDSFEPLLAAAMQGALVAVLPERLVHSPRVPGGALVEIEPPSPLAEHGTHRICMISRHGCDPRENEFLAGELRDVLAERKRAPGAEPSRPRVCAPSPLGRIRSA